MVSGTRNVAAEASCSDACQEEGIADEVAPALARLTGQQVQPLEADPAQPGGRPVEIAGPVREEAPDREAHGYADAIAVRGDPALLRGIAHSDEQQLYLLDGWYISYWKVRV